MTQHIVCRDCDFEELIDDNDKAGDVIWTHAEETGHTVASDTIEGGEELVTDGGTVTAGMLELDPTTEVYLTGRGGGGSRQSLHTDPDCLHLNRGKTTTERVLEDIPEDWPVCRSCLGIAMDERDPAIDVQETRRELLDAAPEDAGLSPLGDRREDNLITDGGALLEDDPQCDQKHCDNVPSVAVEPLDGGERREVCLDHAISEVDRIGQEVRR